MEVKFERVHISNFHFVDIDEVEARDKARVLKKRDTVKLKIIKKPDEKEIELKSVSIFAEGSRVFTFDERYYYIADIWGDILLLDVTTEEVETDILKELYEITADVFSDKFNVFVGLFSQEIYPGTRLPKIYPAGFSRIKARRGKQSK